MSLASARTRARQVRRVMLETKFVTQCVYIYIYIYMNIYVCVCVCRLNSSCAAHYPAALAALIALTCAVCQSAALPGHAILIDTGRERGE